MNPNRALTRSCALLAGLVAALLAGACEKNEPCRPNTARLVFTCGADSAGIDGVSVSIVDQNTPSLRKDGVVVPIGCPGQASLELDVSDYQAGRVLDVTVTPLHGDAGAGPPMMLQPITLAAGCTSATFPLGGSDAGSTDAAPDGPHGDGAQPADGRDAPAADAADAADATTDRPATDAADGPASTDGPPADASGDGSGTIGGNGAACTANGQCASNHCVDGVCCDGTCSGTCQSCLAKNTGGKDGQCGSVTAGTDPDDDCTASSQSGCGLDGYCDGAGACRMWATDTVCGTAAQCNGGQFVPASHCDGHGACNASTTVDCSGYACALPAGCKTTCAADGDCVGVSCVNGMCGGKKPTGAACATGSECALGFCVNQVCCGSACGQTCMACSHALTGMPDGQCQPATSGSDPKNDCAATAASGCSTTGDCDGAGHCALFGATTSCGTESCSGTTHTPLGHCDGQGSCQAASTQSCGLYACGTPACNTTCASDAQCAPTVAYCSGSSCVAKNPNGSACGAAHECQSGYCVDGFCCNSACTATCYSCSVVDTNQPSGQCQPLADGKSDSGCSVQAPSSCGMTGTCNGAGACKLYANGTACGASETCTGTTHTPAGSCNGSGTCVAGTAMDCTPYSCSGGRCTTSCTADADCAPNAACTSGRCTALVCSAGGWCWYNPRPFGGTLGGVWGSSATSAWAVGQGGAIAHWDGTAWSGNPNLVSTDLSDISGASDGTAFAVGAGGTILRYDGFSWRTVASGTTQPLMDVWMTTPSDAWAVGNAVVRWNGSQWSTVTGTGVPTSGTGVWASGASDAYIAAPDGLHHWNGTQWSLVSGPWGTGTPILGVVGSGPNEVWALAGDNLGDFFCEVYRWTGSAWSDVGSLNFCDSPKLSSPGAGEAWIADVGATTVYKNGTLTMLSAPTSGPAVFARTSSDVWVGFQHGDGTTFSTTVTTFGDDYGAAVKAISPTEVWIVGQNDNFQGSGHVWRGSGFTSAIPAGSGFLRLRGVWGDSSTDVWICGEGPVADQSSSGGLTWGNGGGGSTANDYLYGVSGTSAADVWFVGSKGRIWHDNGLGLNTTVASGVTDDLTDVVAISPTDAWAVGGGGRILHGGSQGWSPSTSGTTQYLEGVCANASNDVWAVGGNPVALHWNGSSWSSMASGIASGTALLHVWCASPTEIWAIAGNGAIYQGNGSTWTLSPSGYSNYLAGISGSAHAIWVVGGAGTVLLRTR
jgi:hypothetical protein